MENLKKNLVETVRDESCLQALIEEQYFRLDMRRKAFVERHYWKSGLLIFLFLYNLGHSILSNSLTKAPDCLYKTVGVADRMDDNLNLYNRPVITNQRPGAGRFICSI